VSAVILAGGRSSRFGRNKLAEPIDGRPLLQHAIDGVRPFATEIIVVAAAGASSQLPRDVAVTLVFDPVAFEGPLAGLLAGLAAAHEPIVLVAGGDMPTLVEAVIESMLAELEVRGVDAVVLEHEGRPRPLPMVLRRGPALEATERLVEAGERRLRALPAALAVLIVPEPAWRALDPDGLTMRDIDTPADLG
jgi:molybdopterin-guanine dinucleotide biosynthesis protein A